MRPWPPAANSPAAPLPRLIIAALSVVAACVDPMPSGLCRANETGEHVPRATPVPLASNGQAASTPRRADSKRQLRDRLRKTNGPPPSGPSPAPWTSGCRRLLERLSGRRWLARLDSKPFANERYGRGDEESRDEEDVQGEQNPKNDRGDVEDHERGIGYLHEDLSACNRRCRRCRWLFERSATSPASHDGPGTWGYHPSRNRSSAFVYPRPSFARKNLNARHVDAESP
jgi:hypothetical protein